MKKLILILFPLALGTYSCSPKSHCFFNVKERRFYITDKKNYNIRYVTVFSSNSANRLIKKIELDPGMKSYKIVGDSIINTDVHIFIDTDDKAIYSLKLKKDDWKKDGILKCRYSTL